MDRKKLWYIALGDLSRPFIAATIHCRADVRGLSMRGWDAVLVSQANTKDLGNDRTTGEIVVCKNRPFYYRLLFVLKVIWLLLVSKKKPSFVLFRASALFLIALQLKAMKIPFGVELPGPPCFFEGMKWWRLEYWSDMFYLKNADVIIALNRELADIANQYKKPEAIVAVTGVGVDSGCYSIHKNPDADQTVLTLGFIGTVYLNRCLGNIIEAVYELRLKGINARLVVVGDGKAKAAAMQKACDLGIKDSVIFKGWVAPDHVGEALAECDLMVALYERTRELAIGGINPMKVWTSLSLGRPVLLFNPGRYNAYENVPGIFACPGITPGLLVETIIKLWQQHGKSGLAAVGLWAREYVEKNVTWQKHADAIHKAVQASLDIRG